MLCVWRWGIGAKKSTEWGGIENNFSSKCSYSVEEVSILGTTCMEEENIGKI